MPRRKPRPSDDGVRSTPRRGGGKPARRGGSPQRGDGAAPRTVFGGNEQVEHWGQQEWVVRRLTGASSTKTYRCPGCDQLIPPATPHVVAWPVDPSLAAGNDPGLDERRHWHGGCWQARDRRRPR